MSPSPGASAGGATRRSWDEPPAITRYYETIRSHVRLIVACTLVALVAAAAYVELAPRTYTAQAQLSVNPASAQNTVLYSLPVLHSTGIATQDVLTAATQLHIPAIAQATVSALHLRLSSAQLLGKVSVVPFSQSNIVSISVTDASAAQAQRIANAYASEAIAVRTAALHKAIAAALPGLRTTLAQTPPSQRGGVGSVSDTITQLEGLASQPDPSVAISSQATLPTSPTSPKTKLSIIIGVLVGLLVGIAAAFGIDALDPRVRREEQLRQRFPSIPILGRVPERTGPVKPDPLTPLELPAAALEQYRMLRSTLASRGSAGSQAYLLTGTSPAEGKTTSAINLAATLAQSGREVILIEADLRRPTLSGVLDVSGFHGTEQVLSGDVALDDALEEVALGATRVRLLAAHGRRPADADRLSPVQAALLVQDAKRLADVVVIDSPPLTAVVDALPFARAADQVVLTVRAGHTRLSKLAQATELLDQQDTPPSGMIVIGLRQREAFAYGYYLGEPPAAGLASENGSAGEPAPARLGRGRTRRP